MGSVTTCVTVTFRRPERQYADQRGQAFCLSPLQGKRNMPMTQLPSLVHLLTSLGGAILMLMCLPSVSATAKDGSAIYDDTCVRCHGLLQEQSSWHQFIPTDGTTVDLAVVTPQGPTLNGIIGRPAGIIEGYTYSKGMRAFARTGAVSDRETLDKLLTDSRKFVKGTFMILKLEDEDRALVLDYLENYAVYRP
ncbi:MAG: c-type cytochrome, partial [Geminicoccaceae bacterium]